jgi:hypothetical protein
VALPSAGFFGIPQINVNHWLGFNGDFTESYNTSAGAHQNVQARLGGIVFTAKSSAKVSPFGFADAGLVRNSNDGTVNAAPALALGGGFSMTLTKRVALLFIPGEYIKTWPPTDHRRLDTAALTSCSTSHSAPTSAVLCCPVPL